INVRLSGQDSARGTFSQRHEVLTDIVTGEEIIPLNNVNPNTAVIEPLDSLLSEAAVLGFEFGYSTADPTTLVIWEAQFGDFANAAQVLIDNFIVCSEDKWQVPNNLVLLLPHGQEGQGPEHSSARLERFLALCADGNMTVCNPTTSAQYYHLLRSQGKYKNRRPLVILTPKSLLRHPEAQSAKDEFVNGSYKLVIDDETVDDKNSIGRVIVTSGKVFYDLLKYRRENKIKNTAVVRIERYYPYPSEQIKDILKTYENAKEVVWVQEEPENMGALSFISRKLKNDLAKWQNLFHVCREESPSPAPGSYSKYIETQKKLCEEAFGKLKNSY
ncbi:MAG: multifunctional oxoglutarate decarboxylase/oxoglutarate dehydrogenase thiamine pyrophosphate-binding subunit/dihydrolipoyllysine-residue succinyltransferase subunit, partial [Ignavibacteria bacterium]